MNYKAQLDSLRRRLQSNRHASPTSGMPPLQLHDVSTGSIGIDIHSLEVIQAAPVWMTAAERLLLYTFAFTTRPLHYLEIGTLNGGSALIVCAAMNALSLPGTITCVDPAPQIAPDDWLTLAPRTTIIKGYSPKALTDAVRHAAGAFDLVLIDGDHTYTGAQKDLAGVLPICQPGGYILCHDCFNNGVGQAIDEFADQNRDLVVDFGPLTREYTIKAEARVSDAGGIVWGGLRVFRVR